jgi:Flp pilus assembly protein TadG
VTRGTDDEGSVAVEFAAVASLLFVILFGIIGFALHFGARAAAAQAAAEGARASVAGVTDVERAVLATAAAQTVVTRYGGMLGTPTITTARANLRYEVTVAVDISRFGLSLLTGFVPALSERPSATVSIQIGGFGG